MPGGDLCFRDLRTDNNAFASWIASEDHFGLDYPSSRAAGSVPRQFSAPETLPVARHPQATPGTPRQATESGNQHQTSARVFSDASTQTPGQDAVSAAVHSLRPVAAPGQEAPSTAASFNLRTQSIQTHAVPSHSSRRTRSQVGRDSVNLLWREYLALTVADVGQQSANTGGRLRATNTTNPDSARARNPLTGASAVSQPRPSNNHHRGVTGPRMAPSTATSTTITQGPLSYDKPKGLAAVLVPLLCPSTDFIDMQRLVKLAILTIVKLASLLVQLACLLAPAWLWLIRHEIMLGHGHDAVVIAIAGLLAFLVADAVHSAAVHVAAERRSGIFSARAKSEYQFAPGHYGPVSAASFTNGTAGNTGVVRSASGRPGSSAAAAAGGPAAAGLRGVASPTGASVRGSSGASQTDPTVRQVKQRIIKLEYVLFGNELTEADVSPDALHSRVHLLCTQVGVPFGGPGGSSARPSAAELNQLLLAVESALGVQ